MSIFIGDIESDNFTFIDIPFNHFNVEHNFADHEEGDIGDTNYQSLITAAVISIAFTTIAATVYWCFFSNSADISASGEGSHVFRDANNYGAIPPRHALAAAIVEGKVWYQV